MDEQETALKDRLKTAVKGVPPPPFMEARIRAALHSSGGARRARSWKFVLTAAGALVVCAIGAFEYQHGAFRFNRPSQDAYIASISAYVPRILRVGLGDHIHCSVYRKYPEHPESLQQMIADLGPDFAPLLQTVRSKVPGNLQLVMAHRCSYRQRQFVHFTFKNSDALLSLVIAHKQDGEQLSRPELGQALLESEIPIYRSEVQRFQIAAFDAGEYLAYVISDLSSRQNNEIAAALSPDVRSFLSVRS
ncbi:MAG: hypothetical protein JOZ48_18075 [Acidobacteriaceae bacterium]|nr:hypothetical protein [Acidobacteriaceae bacterium]